MFKSLTIAAGLAASLTLFADPASAQYQRYRQPDPGPAIALGMFGLALGAIAASQAPPPGYYVAPQQDEERDQGSPCAAGFYWDGERCVAD